MIRIAALAASALSLVAAPAAADPTGLAQALRDGDRVKVRAELVTIAPDNLRGLEQLGAWTLRGDYRWFGGLSGLVVGDGRLIAVSDRGWWFAADLEEAPLRLENARIARMRGPDGDGYTKDGGDAEGLTRAGTRLAVSFERDHRIMWLGADGRLGGSQSDPALKKTLRWNQGLEALADLDEDTLLMIGEGKGGVRQFPMFQVNGASWQSGILPRIGRHNMTGADLGPDGRLYLVLRNFSLLSGVSVKIMRYRLTPEGWPDTDSAELLAEFGPGSGIDNMEGISVAPGPDGRLHLWLISDDNFNPLQRTLLMRFAVTGEGGRE